MDGPFEVLCYSFVVAEGVFASSGPFCIEVC